VVDCTRLMPHAYATQMLIALGAEVIKVESPGSGDYGRGMKPAFEASNGYKRSLTLDLRSEQGREILHRLSDTAAVVVESFRPGVMRSGGLDYEALSKTNPALVYCSATGYGQTGPYADKPGHDLNYLSLAGGVAADGSVEPAYLPMPIVDMAAGPFAALAIVAAVAEARATGIGQAIDLSLFDVALSINLLGFAYTHQSLPESGTVGAGLDGLRWPQLLVGKCPGYGFFETSDGRQVSLSNVEEKFWSTFLSLVGLDFAPEDRFATGARGQEVREAIERVIRSRTQEHWITVFAGTDVCFAPVLPSQEVIADEHVRYRDSVFLEDGKIHLRFPARFSRTPARDGGSPPNVGADTDIVLAELGYDAAMIAGLRDERVI
jgi:alpha-methylacyl-CoA racemase